MSDFHFLRPWWLLAFLPVAFAGWRVWATTDPGRSWRGTVASHLLPHLLVGGERRTRRFAVSPLATLLLGWTAMVIALAGPAWQREPAPFADDATVLAIVLKVSPSMLTQDVQPTRLARSVQKIHDLLALRPGARTALIAYTGSAHQVMPLTNDAALIGSFAAELSPEVMPREGDVASEALKLARDVVARSGQRGWVLWICDGVAPDQVTALGDDRARDMPVSLLAAAGEGPERDSLEAAARVLGADLVPVAPDGADVRRLAGNTRFSPARDGTGERWRDAGYGLVPFLCLLGLVWFRPGWVARAGGTS